MKIHLRAESANGHHTKFSVFINGALSGTLTMREDEAVAFHMIVFTGANKDLDQVVSTGKWVQEKGE